MRAVNLVPVERREAASGATPAQPAQVVLLVVLALLLVVAGSWALLRQQTGQARVQAAEAAQRSAVAGQRAAALQPAVALQSQRDERQQAVAKLADERIDWSAVYRRVAGVVPQRVRLTGVDAASVGAGAASGGDSPAPPSGGGGQGASPGLAVEACSPSQELVARTLDGLRSMPDAQSVSLTSSTRAEASEGGEDECSGIVMVASVALVGKAGAAPVAPGQADRGAGADDQAQAGQAGTTTPAPGAEAAPGAGAQPAPSGGATPDGAAQ